MMNRMCSTKLSLGDAGKFSLIIYTLKTEERHTSKFQMILHSDLNDAVANASPFNLTD